MALLTAARDIAYEIVAGSSDRSDQWYVGDWPPYTTPWQPQPQPAPYVPYVPYTPPPQPAPTIVTTNVTNDVTMTMILVTLNRIAELLERLAARYDGDEQGGDDGPS